MKKESWFKYKVDEFKSDSKLTTSEWGKMAITGILAGGLLTMNYTDSLFNILLQGFISVIVLLGWLSLFIWIYRKIKKI